MNGLIVFNSANDVVYHNLNSLLKRKIVELAVMQGLLPHPSKGNPTSTYNLDSNVLLQIFSPIINSQRIMHCQFDNTYINFQCKNDFNMVFGELLGFNFLQIGQMPLHQLSRKLDFAITLTRYFYGANIFGPQAGSTQLELLTQCLDFYEAKLLEEEQMYIVEAIPKLLINMELMHTVHTTLEQTLDQLRNAGYQRAHVIFLVCHKLVSFNSTHQALPLAAADLIFLATISRALQSKKTQRTVAVFLQGASHDVNSGCVPCIVHISRVHVHQLLVQVIEYANIQLTCQLYDLFYMTHNIMTVFLQGDVDAIKTNFENLELESLVNQTLIILKRHLKVKHEELDNCIKKFTTKWESLRKMYIEFSKFHEREIILRIESNMPSFIVELKHLFTLICCDSSDVKLDQLPVVAATVESKLLEIAEFLTVKAKRNISIEAYLEEFPGLLHFIYVNRSTGQMLASDLRSNQVVPKMISAMVELTRRYMKQGQKTVMWKDKTFHFSYFLWFEDKSSKILKSTFDLQKHFSSNGLGIGDNGLTISAEKGALDYYNDLAEVYFPKLNTEKVRTYELFCIHLGLVTATCAAEHARRLVATVSDVIGEQNF
ncbi:uncharacterized protein LOC115624541 [Scaptodrosophila lebanonensis]|uniref:Uncharacterized protein LOC115624541 n=1 Tax=Drosophila lebanonensis TaxID=7225 RepID=A0A6J2TEC4_DROLE|nr:uncharacterized protein LOC115624541 [Scaptodrosophila lebanonensis]